MFTEYELLFRLIRNGVKNSDGSDIGHQYQYWLFLKDVTDIVISILIMSYLMNEQYIQCTHV